MTWKRFDSWLHARSPFLEERAEDALEYLLVVGVLVVAMAVALVIGFEALVPQVVDHTCSSIDTSNVSGAVSAPGACIVSH